MKINSIESSAKEMYLVYWSQIRIIIAIILLSVCLSACMVGPNFRTPSGFKVKRYTETPLPAKTANAPGPGGQTQKFITGKDIPELWWELFHSSAINALIRKGLANSPDLSSAMAALRQAKENLNVQIGNTLWPAIDASGFAQRQRYSTVNIGDVTGNRAFTFNLYNASINLSYTVDVFGGARREIESLRAKVDNQQFEVIAAYLTLTSNIVTTSISIASVKAQIKVTQQLIGEQQTLLNILKQQYHLGGVSQANVLTQQTLLEQTKATLPPLQKSLSQNKHALAVLVGSFPEESLPTVDLDQLKLPVTLPVSVPSLLVRQRPDVRAAEALLHSACAEIGVATANLFPKLDITGYYGWISTSLSNLFSAQNNIWSIMAQVTQPLFHGGALLAQRRAAIAAYQQADAQYRKTVLQAFQNVADVLRALETDARALQAQALAEESARQSLQLTMAQYRLGGTSYINLLNAQQQYLQTRINRIQAQATRFADTAALFQALGGGWWHKPWCVKECL
ncbi:MULTISPECIES: efflux transporter outer membrane subunit [Legionella]|uniref:Outer membrane efflux protein n=1 Tax=Legionella maceachernii TaxID=466 RepID=A0A0W0WGL2_9GAMM|nr:efflux transporter outer membrane subunit [Legionella maceachernii]KTD31445.1 outer membrane efflux protein [Legionella maceachernii]SJZ93519.1 efflux transporter, outer membrane factor (OMF) lipoprotein, NodT family [Legionella maceachernii]SUP03440.1 Outer membrane protein oprM precursor [Legionella maceachernii]